MSDDNGNNGYDMRSVCLPGGKARYIRVRPDKHKSKPPRKSHRLNVASLRHGFAGFMGVLVSIALYAAILIPLYFIITK